MVTITELNRAPDITVNAIDAASVSAGDSLTDPSGAEHTGELADSSDLVSDHSNLSNVQIDQHHTPYSDSKAQDAVKGTVDASELTGGSGSTGQFLQTDGNNTSWASLSTSVTQFSELSNITIHSGESGYGGNFTFFDLASEVTLVGGFISSLENSGFDIRFTDGSGNTEYPSLGAKAVLAGVNGGGSWASPPPISNIVKMEAISTNDDHRYTYVLVTK